MDVDVHLAPLEAPATQRHRDHSHRFVYGVVRPNVGLHVAVAGARPARRRYVQRMQRAPGVRLALMRVDAGAMSRKWTRGCADGGSLIC